MPPRNREAVGSQGKAQGWLAVLQEEHGAAAKGSGLTCQGLFMAYIPCQGSGSNPGSHFLRKML